MRAYQDWFRRIHAFDGILATYSSDPALFLDGLKNKGLLEAASEMLKTSLGLLDTGVAYLPCVSESVYPNPNPNPNPNLNPQRHIGALDSASLLGRAALAHTLSSGLRLTFLKSLSLTYL